MVERVLDSVAPQPTAHPGVTGFYAAGTVVLPTLAQVKHEAFTEEREWRLITTSETPGTWPFGAARGGGCRTDRSAFRLKPYGRWSSDPVQTPTCESTDCESSFGRRGTSTSRSRLRTRLSEGELNWTSG